MAQDAWSERRYVLRLAAIHEDCLPWEWTIQVYQRAVELVGQHCVHIDYWTVEALGQPQVLQEATYAAIEADILSLVVRAAPELPLNLYRWLDSWLPSRPHRAGALIAMLGVPHEPSEFPGRIRECLRNVARLAHLDFLPRERRFPRQHFSIPAASATKGVQEVSHLLGQAPGSSWIQTSA